MSLQLPSTYNPESIVLAIDGIPIDGIAADGITIEREGTSEFIEGMDSGGTYEHNASRTYNVNVTLRAASSGAKRLSAIQSIAYAALQAGGAHPNITGIARDPINGTSVETANVFFMNAPFPDFAQQSGSVEFQLKFANAQAILAAALP